ncbi:hypothetical protein PtA15_13A489 [Puccinia triticina]|nr:uncharacterized protein PtA15_13A489 [Puccinia triticina]WAQ91088.1 hypothetical protein PtA15_13A489 [Puccinia triticina]WAR61277.1 hypothetical protein PtB15_13B532 [Puccinia triticina]
MEWKHARQLWPQYKYHTSIPEFTPIEPYIPKSFATEVFRAIEEAEVDTCPLNAAADEAKVVAWMQAILVKISNLFNGTITNDAVGASKGRIEFIYMVLELCVIVVLGGKCGGIARNNYAQMMTELEGCAMQNVSRGLHLDILHGVLASQSEWYFWTYDGQGFQVSEVIVPFHRNEKQEVLNRLRITSRLLGQFLNGYCSALCAFIQRSEEVGLQQRQEQFHPSHRKWQEASVLAEQAKVKALSAKNEEDFAVFKSLLNQSFDALPEEHQPQL